MSETPLDVAWLRAHSLPDHADGIDKNGRGRVLVVGGSRLCPGAPRLTGEAALRAGAGKMRMAVIAEAAIGLGIAVPEAAVTGLPADESGEIAAAGAELLMKGLGRCDAVVVGPGMGSPDCAAGLVAGLLAEPREGLHFVLDAAAVACAGRHEALLRGHGGRVVLTPHLGEMAQLTGLDEDAIEADRGGTALAAAKRFDAVVVMKGGSSLVAAPDGTLLHYAGGGVGLATGGSGDTLAGIAGALLARGAEPLVATAWAVWLHGEAGRRLAERIGPIGFLARELLPELPALMASV